MRVLYLARRLSRGEDVDNEVLEAAALLHDIGRVEESLDPTGKKDHAILGAQMAEPILARLGFPQSKVRHIQDCILSHRNRSEYAADTLEAKLLFDADKLDTVGAIGIARNYAWIGKYNAHIYYKPNIQKYLKENMNGKMNGQIVDKTKHSPQIEFEVTYRQICKRLYTEKAKKLMRERIRFHQQFLIRLEKEVKGIL